MPVTVLRWSIAGVVLLRPEFISNARLWLHAKLAFGTDTGASGCDIQPQRKGIAGDLINQSHWRRSQCAITGEKAIISYSPSIAFPDLNIVISPLSGSISLPVLG